MKHRLYLIFLFMIMISANNMDGVITGSATALSVQTLITYAGANSILGGAVMTAGFTMAAGVTVAWSSYFPVLGPVTLGTGTITLGRDFLMGGGSTFVNGGTFTCAGFSVVCPQQSTTFTLGGANAYTINGGSLRFNSPVTLNATLNLQGTTILDGGGNVITFGSSGVIAVSAGATVIIKNATLKGLMAGDITMGSAASNLTLQDVTWIQSGPLTLSTGNLNIVNDVLMTGSNIFTYSSANALSINSLSTLEFDLGMTFSYASATNSLLTFSSSSSELFLNGASLFAASAGLNLTTGTLLVANTSYLSTSSSISLGNTVSANDLQVNILPAAQLQVSNGTLNYNNVNAASFQMGSTGSNIYMGNGTILNLFQTLNLGTGNLFFASSTTLGRASGIQILGSVNILGDLAYASL
ncbi:MAG: hypothetical protein NTX86_00165 [Candidatus Dependentiae bacterium]|nr:hypothetical protein [Candidatus Dependentiae bacterium]